MGCRLYVGNLKYEVTTEDLEQLFLQHGEVVDAKVLSDPETGRSRGFGFVEMGSDEQAEQAIESLNGQEYAGRQLTVNEARPRAERSGGGGGGRGGRGGYNGGGRSGGSSW